MLSIISFRSNPLGLSRRQAWARQRTSGLIIPLSWSTTLCVQRYFPRSVTSNTPMPISNAFLTRQARGIKKTGQLRSSYSSVQPSSVVAPANPNRTLIPCFVIHLTEMAHGLAFLMLLLVTGSVLSLKCPGKPVTRGRGVSPQAGEVKQVKIRS